MTGSARARQTVYQWRYVLPGVAAPVGGGLIKIGQGSTWAAVSVSLAPYVVVTSLYAIFIVGYIPAVVCYLFSSPDRQDAISRLITTSADAIVFLLTLTHTSSRRQPSGRPSGSES
jgi:hypothetical protein